MGNGVSEAELVLDVALRLEKLLQKQSGTEVVLTRRTVPRRDGQSSPLMGMAS